MACLGATQTLLPIQDQDIEGHPIQVVLSERKHVQTLMARKHARATAAGVMELDYRKRVKWVGVRRASDARSKRIVHCRAERRMRKVWHSKDPGRIAISRIEGGRGDMIDQGND